MAKIIGIALFALHAAVCLAAETEPPVSARLTIDEAVRIAVEQHPALHVAEHDIHAAEAITKQLEAAYYPQVTAVWQNTGGNTRVLANLSVSGSLPKPTNYLTTPGVRVDYLITDFGHTAHSVLASKALQDATGMDTQAIRRLIVLNVQQAYLNCAKQQRIVDVRRDLLRQWQSIFDRAQALYKRDLRSKLDLEVATAQLKQAELGLLLSENDLRVAFAVLNNAMGRPSVERYEVQANPTATAEPPPLDSLLLAAAHTRPELKGSQARIRAAEEAIQAAKALSYGNITGIGAAGYTWWSREEQPSGREVSNPGAQLGFWGVGLTSAFPLYTGGRLDARVEQAEAQRGEAEASTRGLANDIILQVVLAYLAEHNARAQIRVAEERVAHAREALGLAQQRYKVGLGSILEVTTATASATRAEVGLAEGRYEVDASHIALNYASGAMP